MSSKKDKQSKKHNESSSSSEDDGEAEVVDSDNSDHPITTKKNAKKQTKKNPPGRPRKNPPMQVQEVKGIVNTPDDNDNLFELLYYQPSSMKKIAQLIKSIGSTTVQLLADGECLTLFTQDKYHTNTCMIVFHGVKMHHFYCRKPIDVGISSKNFVKVCEIINKRHACVAISQAEELENTQIEITFLNGHTHVRTGKSVATIREYPRLTPELRAQFQKNDAVVRFQYPSYDFKRLISGSKGIERIRFRQNGGKKPLIVEIDQTDGQITSKDVFDPNIIKVKFQSSVPDNDIFSITASTEALRAISSASLGKNVDVFLTEKSPILTQISVDDGNIDVFTLTKLSERKIKPVTKSKKKNRNESSDEDDEEEDEEEDEELEVPKNKSKVVPVKLESDDDNSD